MCVCVCVCARARVHLACVGHTSRRHTIEAREGYLGGEERVAGSDTLGACVFAPASICIELSPPATALPLGRAPAPVNALMPSAPSPKRHAHSERGLKRLLTGPDLRLQALAQ